MSTETNCFECEGQGSFPRDEAGVTKEVCQGCHGRGLRETAEVLATIEARVLASHGRPTDEFRRDPCGDLYTVSGYDCTVYAKPQDAALVELWLELTGETIRQDSDEPDYDAETASERSARASMEKYGV